MGKGVMALMAMASMIPYSMYGASKYSRSLPAGINLVEEFKLIQQKKSKLSKWDRDTVVKIFHQKFRIVPPPTTSGNEQGQ